ncbi:lysylphosphatidylglycerol synthase transmembrane domain-containing protein [Xanthomonas indica]|uniref:Flippase-like domain-containing protein n=1 Tax=Xanthomonas indica TaxID=2912242 RepID=A0AAU8I3W2_9XANT|nr:lysylphosphatidylglycerol synthase domain-containing protein [Xanthomonas indica]MCI2263308.1 flippase-like domain-containing protein [Xanthomonas indica]
MKSLWRWTSRLLAVALALYVLWFATANLDIREIGQALSNQEVVSGVLAATICYCLIYPLTGFAWKQLLARQSQTYPAVLLTRIIGLTQLAKYVPGNIAQHASRAVLAMRAGVTTKGYVASAGQEALLTVAASLCVGSAALAISPSGVQALDSHGHIRTLYALTCAAFLGAALLCLDLPASSLERSNRLIIRMLGRMGGLPGPTAALTALSAYAVNFLAVGIGIWLLSQTLGADVDLAMATAAFALSWTLGFLAPGAPAGLGAREGIMLLILESQHNHEKILLLVLLTRVASILGDLLVFLLSLATHCSARKENRFQ